MKLKVRIKLFVSIIFVSLISANYMSDHLKNLINVEARVDAAAIDTIKFCFSNEAKHGTVFVGSVENFNIHLLMNYGPVIIFDNESMTADNGLLNGNYKLNIFIVTIEPDFDINIRQLKKSPWWNHEGFFIIIENGLSNTTKCKDARNILQKAWKADILRGIFICTGGENNRVNFYTFNPFTSRAAPSFWKKSRYDIKKGAAEDQWTLYLQEYNPKLLNCKSLDYDKTRHLDGYRGTRAVFSGIYMHEEHKAFIAYLYDQLNVTLSYTKIDDAKDIDSRGITNSHVGNLLANGSIDIRLWFLPMAYMKNIAASDIVFSSGITFISQDRGKKSMFDQIYELFGSRLLLIMLFFSATTVLMFKICMKMDVDLGILEIIRMWSNAGFLKPPINLPPRIYLFGIFFLALILCSVFQGKILGFQLNPNSEKNIDTENDLIVKFKNHKIYTTQLLLNFLDEKLINRSILVNSNDSCIDHVLNDSSSVCAHAILFLRNKALQYPQLYLAKEPFIKFYAVLAMRKNWPLIKRVNKILNKNIEHELMKYKLLHVNKIRINNGTSDKPRPLKREHIYFALKFLATGLTAGFFIFIVELFWHDRTRSIISQMSIRHFIRNMKRMLRI